MELAAQPVPVLREGPIQLLGDRTREGNGKNPRDELTFRKDVEQLLDGGSALPRPVVSGANHLQGLGVGCRRNPWESAPGCHRGGRDYLESLVSITLLENVHEPAANVANAVVDNGVLASSGPAGHAFRGAGCC